MPKEEHGGTQPVEDVRGAPSVAATVVAVVVAAVTSAPRTRDSQRGRKKK